VVVGDKVSEGTPLLVLALEGDGPPEDDRAAEPAGTPANSAPAETPAPTARAEPPAPRASAEAPAPTTSARAPATEAPTEAAPAKRVYAGPAVRRRARELGIELSEIQGSGAKGRVTLEDLDRVVAPGAGDLAAGGTAQVAGDGLGLAPWPVVDFSRYGEVERVELSKIKQVTGSNLARNWVRIPHVTHNDEADVTALEDFRKRINSEQDVKVTMVSLLMKACAAALRSFPRLNASLDGQELVLKHYYHLGFAVDTPAGLVVPVVREVDRKGLLELAGELAELSAKARSARLTPAEMSGASFTISSLGGIGGTSFTPIINAPEVAILGVTRAAIRPVWDGQQFQPRLMLPLSLSYDHRVIDGAEAARFCAHLASLLADMRRVLL
jgi:pyruvate dehydrogenase E2 component (dihydrolipoamide acetyltransferase)